MIENDNTNNFGSFMKKVRICLVGAGRAGMIHAVNFATRIPTCQIVSVVEPQPETLANHCKVLGVENGFKMFQEAVKHSSFDAVVIASPPQNHLEVVEQASKLGCHIFCEKPMAMTTDECKAMIAAVEKAGVKLQLGFMRRFDKSFMDAKERIAQGLIGNVVMVRSLTYGPSTPQPWMYDISKSNGPLSEVNSHDIDTLRWFTGSEFKQVYAIADNFRCPEARAEFPDFYDNVVLSATFENGCQGCINGAQGVKYGYDSRCEILGTEGILFVGSLAQQTTLTCNVQGMQQPIVQSWRNLFAEAYLAEDADFIRCILEDQTPKAGGLDGLRAVEVVNAGNRSIREKRTVTL